MLKENMNIRVDEFEKIMEKFKKHIYEFVTDYNLSPMELYILTKIISDDMLSAAISDEPVVFVKHRKEK